MITIFTPTYNRAKLLLNIYDCLIKQTSKNFEWVIVDDGSTDGTGDVIQSLNSDFPIKYIFKQNGGKHTAINLGVKYASGELFWIIDSDDSLPLDAVETIQSIYSSLQIDKKSIAGICGLMAHHTGEIIGSGFPFDSILASSLELRYKYKVAGDLMEIFRTDILKEFPFPEISGERFCPEQLVWFRIAKQYPLYCVNKIIYYRDYLKNGLTANIVRIRMNSPSLSMLCYKELCESNVPIWARCKAAINYWRFGLCKRISTPIFMNISPIWIPFLPIGYFIHIVDMYREKEHKN